MRGDSPIKEIDQALDAWLAVRVAAHDARGGPDAKTRAITVPTYLAALAAVRKVEGVLDDWRYSLGATSGRAFEICTTNEQLTLEVAA